MRPRTSTSAAVFERVLGAFATGGFNYADFLTQSKQIVANAASPIELLEVLQRFELVEPLPEYAYAEVLGLLNDAIGQAAAQKPNPDTTLGQFPDAASAPPADEEVTIDFDQLNDPSEARVPEEEGTGHFSPGAPRSTLVSTSSVLSEFVRPSAGAPPSLAGRARALEEQIARQAADHEALTRSYQRARDGEAAARTALELEQWKTRDLENALAERIASAEATRLRSEEALGESARYQTESRALRDSLAARDETLVQSRHSLGEREAQLAALQQEYAKLVPTLEARAKSAMQLQADLRTAQGGASALAADLVVARNALESEQRKVRDLDRALTERVALADAANSRGEVALRELERRHTESRSLRDLLAARDAALVQARRSLAEREAQLATLQQEHAKMLSALEARAKAGTRLEADLQTAQARADAISSDLKAAQEVGAELKSRLKRREDELNAALIELGAAETKESSHLELLRTRDWRDGFDHNLFRELDARADAAVVERRTLQTERDRLQAQVADLQTQLEVTERPAAAQPRESERVTKLAVVTQTRQQARTLLTQDSVAVGDIVTDRLRWVTLIGKAVMRRGTWNRRAVARAMAVSGAVIVLAAVAWSFVHQTPVPPPPPAVVAVAVPKPGTVIRDCPTCPAMTVLPAGRFRQGSDRPESGSESFAKPSHWVAIGRPLAMATNAVTVDEFQEFIAATGQDMQGCDTYDGAWKHRVKNDWKNPGFVQTGTHPVTCVSWNDAKAYASWLSTKTGHGYRLPSASEWEYAARAGGEAAQPWNPDGSGACENANVADQSAAHRYPGWAVFACDDGYVYTAPVGSFRANSLGLNDMLGNVFQWTEDCWSPDYTGAPTDGSARTDGNCTEHELRGGSWFSTPAYVTANYRNHFAADYRTSSVGIRLVRAIEQ